MIIIANMSTLLQSLGEDNFNDVLEAVLPIKSVYFSLGQCLGLPTAVLESIREEKSDTKQALTVTLMLWLRQQYDSGRFGRPTWRMLVKAVNQEAGGNNNELAKKIASNHRAISRHLTKLIIIQYLLLRE